MITNYEKRKLRRKINLERLQYLKSGVGCSDCGFSNPAALTFHHLRDKVDSVYRIARERSWDKVEEELEKCVILCANCHTIKHTEVECYTKTG